MHVCMSTRTYVHAHAHDRLYVYIIIYRVNMHVYKLFKRTHTLTHTSTFIDVCSLYCIIMYTSAMTFKTNALTYPQLSSASNQEAIGICHQYPVWIITQSLVETSADII